MIFWSLVYILGFVATFVGVISIWKEVRNNQEKDYNLWGLEEIFKGIEPHALLVFVFSALWFIHLFAIVFAKVMNILWEHYSDTRFNFIQKAFDWLYEKL